MSQLSTNQKGMIFALIGYTGFAWADGAAKALVETYPPLQIAAVGNVIACIGLLLVRNYLGGWRGATNRRELWFHGVRTILNIALSIIVIYSFSLMALSEVYAMIFAKPFFAGILAMIFYKETVTPGRWFAIFIGFLGVMVVLQPSPDTFRLELLYPLGAAFLVALMFVLSRSLREASPFVMSFYPMAGSAIGAILLAWNDFVPLQSEHFHLFIMDGVFVAIGVTAVSLAFRLGHASVVAPFLYTEMIWALLFGALFFANYPNSATLIGSAIIISSGLYLILVEKWRRTALANANAAAIPRPLTISEPQPWNFFDKETMKKNNDTNDKTNDTDNVAKNIADNNSNSNRKSSTPPNTTDNQ